MFAMDGRNKCSIPERKDEKRLSQHKNAVHSLLIHPGGRSVKNIRNTMGGGNQC